MKNLYILFLFTLLLIYNQPFKASAQCSVPPPGANLSNAYDINDWKSEYDCGVTLNTGLNEMNPSLCYGNDYGQPGDDVFYSFTLDSPSLVSFKTEGEGDGSDEITPDTYLHLLNEGGNLIF